METTILLISCKNNYFKMLLYLGLMEKNMETTMLLISYEDNLNMLLYLGIMRRTWKLLYTIG